VNLHLHESIVGFFLWWGVGVTGGIQREVSEEMVMLVVFTTAEGDVLIVDGFLPFFILIFKLDRAKQWL
jgi:hypothetical protein